MSSKAIPSVIPSRTVASVSDSFRLILIIPCLEAVSNHSLIAFTTLP